jgi:hypothetical protein
MKRVKGAVMTEPALIIEVCVECERDIEHCHGTAIVHFDGSADCAEDPGCRMAAEQHLFVITCGEVECSCGDPQPGAGWPAEQAAAS